MPIESQLRDPSEARVCDSSPDLAGPTLLGIAPGTAQPPPPPPFFLQKWEWGGNSSTIYCSYTSWDQCRTTAPGPSTTCLANPYWSQALPDSQGTYAGRRAAPKRPSPSRRMIYLYGAKYELGRHSAARPEPKRGSPPAVARGPVLHPSPISGSLLLTRLNVGLPEQCLFSTYSQCLATASGANAYCGLNPVYAFRE